MKKLAALIIAVACLCFAGCDTDTNTGTSGSTGGDEQPFTGLTSVDEVIEYLSSDEMLPYGQTPDDPIELSVKIDASEWPQLFQAIADYERYVYEAEYPYYIKCDTFVALDISHCYNVPQVFNYKMINYHAKIVSMVLPAGITTLYASVFSSCTNLTEIDLPSSLAGIGYEVFYNCSSLERIICRAITPPVLHNQAFRGLPDTTIIEVPANSLQAYITAWDHYMYNASGNIVASQDF